MFPSYVVNSANKVLSSTKLGKTVHLDMAIVETQFNNVPSYSGVTQAAWHIVNGGDVPTCNMCDKPAKFLTGKRQYWSWCSNKCMGKDPVTLAKKRATNTERHGDPHPQRLDWVKQKQGDTMEQKYGFRNAFQVPEIKEKIKNDLIEQYGVDNSSKRGDIKAIISQKAKGRDMGVIMSKRVPTNLKKYGSTNNSNAHISDAARALLNDYDWMYTEYIVKENTGAKIGEMLGCTGEFVCRCLHELEIPIQYRRDSQAERDMCKYISSLFEIDRNNRKMIKPKELDAISHDLKVAFEMNGVYWHSEYRNPNNYYHYNKSAACNALGYTLFHITEGEWDGRQEAIKSLISRIGGASSALCASECEVAIIEHDMARDFFEENYYTDFAGGELFVAIVKDFDILSVAAITDMIVEQYCEKLYTNVEGGLDKIATFLFENSGVAIGYASNQNFPIFELVHSKNFEFVSDSDISCKYFQLSSPNKAICAYSFTGTDPESVDERVFSKIMKKAGLSRIWDAGTKLYKWNSGI